MENKNQKTGLLLAEIQYSITDIEEFTQGVTKESFCKSRLLRRAISQAFAQIGEAANNIRKQDSEFSKKYPLLN